VLHTNYRCYRLRRKSLEQAGGTCHNDLRKDFFLGIALRHAKRNLFLDQASRQRCKRWILAAIKLLIVATVIWFIRRTLVDAWTQLGARHWQFDIWWLAASGGLYLFGTLLCGIFWHRALRALGQNVSLPQALRAYYIGHLGKYVPGKAMVVILRTGLVRGEGVDTALAAASVFFETLTMMAVGAFMSAAIVAIWFHEQTLLFSAAMAMMLVAGLPTLPPVFRRIVRLMGVGRANPAIIEKLADLGYGTMLLGWLLTAISWVMVGLSSWAVLRSLGAADANPIGQLHLYTAAVTLATVVGFVSFVPGGAVVREAALAQFLVLMMPQTDKATALVTAILLRLVWLVAELVISGILYFGTVARSGIGRELRDES
jgi:glycosyltransferase 2 family protein